ncbi:hypothetical protein BJX64DRAFT_302340 [Aspergillus heterothallicus]
MGDQHVVLFCLANIGKADAALAAGVFRMSYPNIRHILVVGVCGAVPSHGTKDIYLSDVVIGKGLMIYDSGRCTPSGFEPRHKSPREPDIEVAHLHRHLELNEGLAGFRTMFTQNLSQLPEDQWRLPVGSPDITYDTNCIHKHRGVDLEYNCRLPDKICDDAAKATCETLGCDKSATRSRHRGGPYPQPQFHFGIIGTADSVMRSAKDRDELARKYNTITFEMEGSGASVLNNLTSCIVVKGVCDYADSHKHKRWQEFAAATGAAAAKSLIQHLPLIKGRLSKQLQQFSVSHNSFVGAKDHCHLMVPFKRNPCFVGHHDQIQELEGLILAPDGPRKLALTGLGGVGKFQIAVEIAYRLQDTNNQRPEFWVSCISLETIEQGFSDIVHLLDLQRTSPARAKETIQAHFSGPLTKWLLILDNLDDQSTWNFLEGILPQSDQGRILITTRSWKVAADVAATVGSGVLRETKFPDEATALQMLKAQLLNKDLVNDVTSAAGLVRRLNCLPLAITQAAAYMNHTRPDATLLDYLSIFDQQEDGIAKLLSEDFQDETRYPDATNPVAKTWLASFEQIRKTSKTAAMYLSLMACVNPSRIPHKLEALFLLNGFSFITMEPHGGHITMHRLVHIAARRWTKEDGMLRAFRYRAEYKLKKSFPDIHGSRMLVG